MTQVIILAGGFATRLWPLTESTCKPLLSVGGTPIIGRIIAGLPTTMPIWITTNQVFAQSVEAFCQDAYPDRDITVFVEDGTSEQAKTGALAAASLTIDQFQIEDDVILIGGDNLFGFQMADFITRAQEYNAPTMAVYDIGQRHKASSFGVVVMDEQTHVVTAFLEKPADPPSSLVSTACYYLPREYVPQMQYYAQDHEDDIGGVFEHFVSTGALCYGYRFNEKWYDIGSFTHYLSANREIYGEEVSIDPEAYVAPDTTLRGMVIVEAGVTVQGGSHLENVIIQAGSTIIRSEVHKSVIGQNSSLKDVSLSGLSLRAGSIVQRNTPEG